MMACSGTQNEANPSSSARLASTAGSAVLSVANEKTPIFIIFLLTLFMCLDLTHQSKLWQSHVGSDIVKSNFDSDPAAQLFVATTKNLRDDLRAFSQFHQSDIV